MVSQHEGSAAPLVNAAEWIGHPYLDGFFQAAAEATAEAILNALLQAETMSGRDGVTAHALDGELLVRVLDRYGRRTFRPR